MALRFGWKWHLHGTTMTEIFWRTRIVFKTKTSPIKDFPPDVPTLTKRFLKSVTAWPSKHCFCHGKGVSISLSLSSEIRNLKKGQKRGVV